MSIIHGPEIIGLVPKSIMKQFKKIFKECFPKDAWSQAIPFKSDDVLWATVDKKIVGICMFHTNPPEKFHSDGFYMYNLGVVGEFRKRGIATKMLDKAKKNYNVIHCHHISSDGGGS